MSSPQVTLDFLLGTLLDEKGSDLHLCAGTPPQIRVDGGLQPIGELLSAEDTKRICYECLLGKERLQKQFEDELELDMAIDFKGRARFRVNLFYQKDTIAGALRVIPSVVPSLEQLNMPEVCYNLTELPRGLVLVTGPTGSGKSTTLAAMINEINAKRNEHIITVEDPIEFVHQSKKSVIVQREVQKDTKSFKDALKRILRQDPDVVLIGEMRDLETISAAITISETGHLAFGTLHTNSAIESINRIIDVFSPHQQTQVRTQLSFVLQGVLTQSLVPKIGGGRALAMEIFIPTIAIRNLIRENKIHQLYASMQLEQKKTGMQTMNQALAKLYDEGKITYDDALDYSSEVAELKKLIGE